MTAVPPIQLVVLDIDGTLLGAGRDIAIEVVDAISQSIDRGVMVALSTGRPPYGCATVAAQLPFRDPQQAHIVFDGAAVSSLDGNVVVMRQAPDQGTLRRLLALSREHQLPLEMYTTAALHAETRSHGVTIQEERLEIEATIGDLEPVIESGHVIKAGMVLDGPDREAHLEIVRSALGEDLHLGVARSPMLPGADFVNITAPGVSKGRALACLAETLGVPLEATLAIGDSYNDLTLLQTAGLGVAMGNAVPELRALARYQTATLDEHGVAVALHRFILNA